MRLNPQPERAVDWQYIRSSLELYARYSRYSADELLNHADELYQALLKGDIPDFYPPNNRGFRDIATSFRMWAFINKPFCSALAAAMEASFGPNATYLEIMAGTGWLAKGLIEADLKGIYIATDLEPPDDAVFPVSKVDAVEAIKKHEANVDAFVVSWPPYNDPIIEKCLDVMPVGAKLIYIGEGYGGCTATHGFFKRTTDFFKGSWDDVRNKFILQSPEHGLWYTANQALFVWDGIHDCLGLLAKTDSHAGKY